MAKKNKTLLIIDGQNAAWRAFHAYSRLSYKGQGVGMIYGLPSMLGGLIKRYKPTRTVVAWEGKRSAIRSRILPGYKDGRKSKSLIDYEDFMRQKDEAMKILFGLGVPQAHNMLLEGDDMLFKLWKMSKTNGYDEVTLVSSDKDFNQLVGYDEDFEHTTKIFNPGKELIITQDNCKKIFGYETYQTVDYLTLVGDKSDNIPGYRGIGEKKAVELLEKYDSLANFIKSKDKHPIIERKMLLELMNTAQSIIDLREYYQKYVKFAKNCQIQWYGNNRSPQKDSRYVIKIAAKYNMQRMVGKSFLENF